MKLIESDAEKSADLDVLVAEATNAPLEVVHVLLGPPEHLTEEEILCIMLGWETWNRAA